MASDTGGVKSFPIAGRMVRERERLHGSGMTDAERKWRAQFLKDQHLAPNEPVNVPEIYKELNNPIRRFYKTPLNKLYEFLVPKLGEGRAYHTRVLIGKFLMTMGILYAVTYHYKYNCNDWTRTGGWRLRTTRRAVYPGEPEYPKVSDRTLPEHYASRGFDKSPI